VLPIYPKSFIKLELTGVLVIAFAGIRWGRYIFFVLGISFQIHPIRQTSGRVRMLRGRPAARRNRNSQAIAILFGRLA
jgi:hypothetical protein